MSWYNNTASDFQDANQLFLGGGGGGSVTIINEGDTIIGTGTDTTLSDIIDLRLDHFENQYENSNPTLSYNLYIKNNNAQGEIRFYTIDAENNNDVSNNALKYNVKIGTDGKLYLYYTYNFLTSALITSGWTDVIDYIVGIKQATFNNAAAIVAEAGLLQGQITTLDTAFIGLTQIVNGVVSEVVGHEARILLLEARGRGDFFSKIDDFEPESFSTVLDNIRNGLRNEQIDLFDDLIANSAGSVVATRTTALSILRQNLITNIVASLLFGGVTSAILAGSYYLLDYLRKQSLDKEIVTNLKVLEGIKSDPDKNIQDKIYLQGLQIDQNTNNNFTTAGVYDNITIQNGAILIIEITSSLVAQIKSITNHGTGNFSAGDIITIPKSSIGGTTGNLVINVNTVASVVEIIELKIIESKEEVESIDNRTRRRQFIPNKNDFQNGLLVNEINVTEPSGETTKQLSIQLRLDTSQFTYNGAGQLQLIDYDKISEIGDNTPNLETGLYNLIKQNENAINNINNQFGTEATYDPQTGQELTPNTGVYINIDNVYEIIMTDQQTFQNNLDYKLNLGYKSIWRDYHYDLITIALKQKPAGTTFGGSDYNNDYLGLFPSLVRLTDFDEMLVVQDIGIRLLQNLTIQKGYLFFENVSNVKNYDLNRKFEFVIFLRPYDIDNLDVEYEILQTGVDLGFQGGVNLYDFDGEKLKVYIKNNKLNVSHYIKKNTYYYQSQTADIFLTYLLATFGSQGALTTLPITGYKDLHMTLDGNTFFYGLRNTQTGLSLPTDQEWYDIVRGNGLNANSFYYWYFYLPKTTSTTLWESPIIFYEESAKPQTRSNLSKIVIKYDYEKYASSSGLWSAVTFPSVLDIENNLEFRMRLETKRYADPLVFHGAILIDFNQITKTAGTQYYTQELFLYGTSPILTDELYDSLDLYLIHKGSPFQALPTGNTGFYNGQHRIKIYAIDVMEYDSTPTILAPTWELYNAEDTTDFFETPIDATKWNKLSLELDLPNKSINYYVNEVAHSITLPDEFSIAGAAFTNEDPYITSHPQSWIYANNNDADLIRNNNIIIMGNQPSTGEINYSHFNWKFFQDPSDVFMTQEQRDKLDFLINYRYYYESVVIDRYLKCKEAYIDVLDCRKVLVNGGFTFDEMIPTDQLVLLRSEDQSTDNVNIATAFVSIDKLYNPNPTITGFLAYDHTTKEFYITSTSVNQADIDTGVNNLIKTTPSTYGLIFNDTDPADKFLEIDSAFINTLINLVIQNELNITQQFFDAKYNDVLIQVKDGSIYSPFDLRELPNTDVLYNYVINGNHQYLYREINQLAQYHPTLGSAYGDLNPIVSYDFIGQIINNAPDSYGYTASDYDLEKVTPAGQVVYGVALQNMKGEPALAGGTTELLSANNHVFGDASSGCISFFHKPYTSNTASDNHTIFKIQNSNGDYIIEFKLEYISNVATYKLILTDPNDNANILTTTFNNSDNEIYFGNENNILLWYDYPNYSWYINGKYHGSIINGFNLGLFTGKIRFDLSQYNNKCVIGEVKVYPRLLFRTGGTAQDLDFNYKRVAEISEMYRIEQIGTNGGFIIKELSGVQQTKVRSIETRRRVQVLEEQGTGTSYTDSDVRNVLSQSAGANLNWNAVSFQFDLDSSISTAITNNTNNIVSNTTDITNLTTALNGLVFYTDADVRNVLSQSAGANLNWNATNNQFDLNTNLTIGSSFSYNNGTGTLSVLKFSGNGSSLSQLDAGNISSGTLSVTRGGTGRTSFPAVGGILIGNVSGNPYQISQVSNLTYENSTGTLIVKKIRFPDQSVFSTANFVSTITTNTANIGTLQNNVTTLQGDVATAQTDITNLQSQQSINTTNIGNNINAIFVLQQRVTGNEADILQNANDIANLQTDLFNTNSSLSTNSGAITQIQTDISANTTAIGNNSVKIADNEADIVTLQNNVSTLQTDVSNNATNIATNTSDISTLQTDVSNNATNIANNTADISTANTNITTNANNIATNTSDIATANTNITTNANNIATNTSDIATANTNITTNANNIATNTSDIATLTANAFDGNYLSLINQPISYATGVTGYRGIGTNAPQTLLHLESPFSDTELTIKSFSNNLSRINLIEGTALNQFGGHITYDGLFNKLHLGMYNNYVNTSLIILDRTTNFVGIKQQNPTKELDIAGRCRIYEATGTQASATNASLLFEHGNTGGASSIVFKSHNNSGSDFGYIQYQDADVINATNERSKLIIGTQNDVEGTYEDDVIILPSANCGINQMSPTEKLDVGGNIRLTGSIFFDDGSTFSAGLYLYKTSYDSSIISLNLASPTGWRIPTNQFTSGGVIYSVGATWNIGTNGIIIPKTGYYEITINHYFNVTGTDRASMISAISINGTQTIEYVCGSYVRFNGGDRGSRGNNGVIIESLTAGDQVSSAWYETGDSSAVNLAVPSTFTIKRIG